MSIAVMKQALEALADPWKSGPDGVASAITALRAAIEQYDQTALELCEECGWRAMIPGEGCLTCARQKAKPVAWRWKEVKGEFVGDWVLTEIEPPPYVTESMPLYTAPRQWVELTDDEARALVNRATFGDKTNWQALVYMIDAKLKEKNT
jgi:hypothetical protein